MPPRQAKRSTRLTPLQKDQLQEKWENRLSEEGLGVVPLMIDHVETRLFVSGTKKPANYQRMPARPDGESFDVNDDLLTIAQRDFSSTDNFEAWYQLEHSACALPGNYRRRRFLIDWTRTGNIRESARNFKLGRGAALNTVHKFLERLKLASPETVD